MATEGRNKLRKAFTLIIVVSITIIFSLGFNSFFYKIRDSKRKSDLRELVQSLDIFYDHFGKYPDSEDDWQGWDTTYIPQVGKSKFLSVLLNEHILKESPYDPINSKSYFYRYQKFPAGAYGCSRSFYILQITNFETVQENNGNGICPEKDFTAEVPNGYTVMGID